MQELCDRKPAIMTISVVGFYFMDSILDFTTSKGWWMNTHISYFAHISMRDYAITKQ